MDYHSDIVVIKNERSDSIIIAKQPDEVMTDSILYNDRIDRAEVGAHGNEPISIPNIKLGSQPNSAKVYLYVFNLDSVRKYQTAEQVEGVVKSSLIKQIGIQLNMVKEPMDTVYIK